MQGRDFEDLNQLPHLEDQPVYEQYRVRLPVNKWVMPLSVLKSYFIYIMHCELCPASASVIHWWSHISRIASHSTRIGCATQLVHFKRTLLLRPSSAPNSPHFTSSHFHLHSTPPSLFLAHRYSAKGVIVGEGKPENQCHAIIFAHMEGIQAIDMNQVGA